MAYLFRLIIGFAFLLPTLSFAVTAGSSSLSYSVGGYFQFSGPDPASGCSAFAIGVYGAGASGTVWSGTVCEVYTGTTWRSTQSIQSRSVLTCPSNSTASGSFCICTPPFVENATQTQCVSNQNCPAGQSISADVGLGWYPDGTSSLVYLRATPASICTPVNGKNCGSSSSFGMAMLSVPTNGSRAVTLKVSGTLTGSECSGPLTPSTVTDPPPPCVGQQGTVNGLVMCLPTESDASKNARAAAAAAASAASASAAATASGASPGAAAAAGAAAGAAAASASLGGASAAAAAASGASAGAAASASGGAAGAAAGASKSASDAAAVAGGDAAAQAAAGAAAAAAVTAAAGAAADAAAAAAAAAGKSAAEIAVVRAAAADAAAAASAAAAKAAGDAAAASSAAAAKAAGDAAAAAAAAAGQSAAEIAAARAAAAASAAAAQATRDAAAAAGKAAADAAAASKAAIDALKAASDKNQISDFCKENPAAKICKIELDATFGGSCGSAPACTGDAVMCAVAAATFSTNCKLTDLTKSDDVATARANAALDGSDGQNTDSMKAAAHSSAVQISNFDVAGKGWSRSCPADPVIPISWGSVPSFTLPISKICSPLQILASSAVGITLLASLVWVIGGRKT